MSEWTWRTNARGGYWARHHGAFTGVIHHGVVTWRAGAECHPLCASPALAEPGQHGHGHWHRLTAPGASAPTAPARYSVAIAGPTGTERYVLADSLAGARVKVNAALVRRQRAWEAARGS